MKIALGVSMTPTTVGIALVEGEKADGVIVEHDVFEDRLGNVERVRSRYRRPPGYPGGRDRRWAPSGVEWGDLD